MFRALSSDRADLRASSIELVESLVSARNREPILGLVDADSGSDTSPAARLRRAGPYTPDAPDDYDALLRELLDSESDSVRGLAVYHVGELGLSALRPRIEALDPPKASTLATMIEQTLDMLGPEPEVAQ